MKKPDKGYPEFPAPEGLDVSDLEDGAEKEVLAKIKLKPDGNICIVSVEGIPLGKDDSEDETPEEDSTEGEEEPQDYASSIMQRAQAGGLM